MYFLGLTWVHVHLLLTIIGTTHALNATWGFNRKQCANTTAHWLLTHSASTTTYFALDPFTNLPMTHPDNVTLTLAGCREFCGGWTWYWDAGPRVTTWIVPILLLLSNIELTPIDKRRFMTVIHVLGDPIDSLWSLTHKIYTWHRLYELGLRKPFIGTAPLPSEEDESEEENPSKNALVRFMKKFTKWLSGLKKIIAQLSRTFVEASFKRLLRLADKLYEVVRIKIFGCDPRPPRDPENEHRARIIATVLAGFEELSGARIESEQHYLDICKQFGNLGETNEDNTKFEEWHRAARQFADGRTNEYLRTVLAIIVYLFGLLGAFVADIGGDSTTPAGGRIGAALFLSWLVPLVLLSNTIGAFTSRRTCLDIMSQFVMATYSDPDKPGNETVPGKVNEGTETAEGGAQAVATSTDHENTTMSGALADSSHRNNVASATDTTTDPRGPASIRTEDNRNLTAVDANAISNASSAPSSNWPLPVTAPPPRETRTTLAPPPSPRRGRNKSVKEEHELSSISGSSTGIMRSTESSRKSSILSLRSRPKPVATWAKRGGSEKNKQLFHITSWDSYFDSMQYLGSIYPYRPWKAKHVLSKKHPIMKTFGMAMAAWIPIMFSSVSAFMILWFAVPSGFSCRHMWVTIVFFSYIISALTTWTLYFFVDGALHWWLTIFKDAVVGLGSVLMVFFSTAGIFNDCKCWGAELMFQENAVIPLNTESIYEVYADDIYSYIVLACILLQLIYYFIILFWWRNGIKLVRWSETKRRAEWKHTMGNKLRHKKEFFLIFWSPKEEKKDDA